MAGDDRQGPEVFSGARLAYWPDDHVQYTLASLHHVRFCPGGNLCRFIAGIQEHCFHILVAVTFIFGQHILIFAQASRLSVMYITAVMVALLLGFATLGLALWTLDFMQVFWRATPNRLADGDCPAAVVLMGLKGIDPFLASGLQRLLTQDYPFYSVHFVIESRADPAWEVVQQAIQSTNANHATMQEFVDCPENGIVNCTNSKVVQALRSLDKDSFDIVAMADGDVVADRFWLRDLVTPLVQDDTVGVASGNRWFVPDRMRIGSMVRCLWNMVATTLMYQKNMPWGGCYAIRQQTIRDGNLIEKWARIGALDMFTTREMRELGLSIAFVPTLMMINREECGLAFSFNYIRRQLTWAQLYNPAWPLIIVQSFVAVLLILASVVLSVAGLVTNHWPTVTWAGGGVLLYSVGIGLLAILHDISVRGALARSGQQTQPLTWGAKLSTLFMIPLIAFMQLAATLHCLLSKRIAWRGSMLEFNGPHDIRVIDAGPSPENDTLKATGAGSR